MKIICQKCREEIEAIDIDHNMCPLCGGDVGLEKLPEIPIYCTGGRRKLLGQNQLEVQVHGVHKFIQSVENCSFTSQELIRKMTGQNIEDPNQYLSYFEAGLCALLRKDLDKKSVEVFFATYGLDGKPLETEILIARRINCSKRHVRKIIEGVLDQYRGSLGRQMLARLAHEAEEKYFSLVLETI